MCKCNKDKRIDESYISFKNIDCFENACLVIDNLLRILKDPEKDNVFWKQFTAKISKAYYSRNAKDDPRETLLFEVCKNAPYIMEFFEESEDEDAIHALDKCIDECC